MSGAWFETLRIVVPVFTAMVAFFFHVHGRLKVMETRVEDQEKALKKLDKIDAISEDTAYIRGALSKCPMFKGQETSCNL